MSIPALESVKYNFPECNLTVLAKPWVIPLFEHHPAVDRILILKKEKGFPGGLKEIRNKIRTIRDSGFDIAVLFQNAFEAALLAYMGGIEYRVGYNTDGRGFLLTHAVIKDDYIRGVHHVDYYKNILGAMGWKIIPGEPKVFLAKEDMNGINSILLDRGIRKEDFLVGLSPGAIFGPAKRWPCERFAKIGDWAYEKWGARVLIFGSGKEKDLCRAVAESMKYESVNLSGDTTLGEAMALIKSCRFFVSNDSGLMHVAAALDVPMVAIFGSTEPALTGPRSLNARVLKHDMECSPCFKPTCSIGYPCLMSIQPDEVWNEMESSREQLS